VEVEVAQPRQQAGTGVVVLGLEIAQKLLKVAQ
jgi:hypothetical protein